MIIKEKKVFYCSHCAKHGLSRSAMEQHEDRCTLNPDRRCRWVIAGEKHETDLPRLVRHLKLVAENADDPHRRFGYLNTADIDWLRGEVNGCPACMLAALRQSGLDYHYDGRGLNLWDYEEEVERFRKDEREADDHAEFRRIEAGWA